MESTYALLDSGNGAKLERFGSLTVTRPTTLCLWSPRLSESAWDNADASYNLEKGSWHRHTPLADGNLVDIGGVKLELRLQPNGQLGIFPEHCQYLDRLLPTIEAIHARNGSVRILNLFAYTGLLTCCCAKAGAEVTHVDMMQKVNDWTKSNLLHNEIPAGRVRLITEDALSFLYREERRGNLYDIVIADPPSFSRVSKQVVWNLEEKLAELTHQCLKVLKPDAGALFMTNHSSFYSGEIVRNLALDFRQEHGPLESHFRLLGIPELDSERTLPAGSLQEISWGVGARASAT